MNEEHKMNAHDRTARGKVMIAAIVALAVSLSLSALAPAAEPGGKIKVLLFQTGGHDWRGFTEVLGKMVAPTGDFDVTATGDRDQLKAGNLHRFKVVMFYGSGNDFSDPAQEQGLDTFVRGGGGLVGVHATDAFKKSDVYWHLMGGRFTGHGGGKFRVVIMDRQHPVTQGIGDFEITDETYRNDIHKDAALHHLVRMDRGQQQQSMGWVQQVGKGRVFSTTLGHDNAAWASPEFQRLVVRGLYWAAGREESPAAQRSNIEGAMRSSAKDLTRMRYLVLDSRIIESTENAELTVGTVQKNKNNPLFKEDKPWEPRFDNPYCSVIYDDQEKIYKCWYSIFTRSGPRGDFPGEGLAPEKRAWVNWREGARGFGVCYAISKDGIHWEKPELGLIDFQGSKKNNLVIEYTHGVAVIKDLHETDPEKRYKAIHPERKDSAVWFSPDGIRWGKKQNAGPIAAGDTAQAVWWDEDLGQYVLITRHWGGEKTSERYGSMGHRQKVRSVSADFLHWSKPEPLIKGLDLRLQIHDMPVVKHAGVYLGMVGLFDVEINKQWCELAWSSDSIVWHRIQPGKPLIPNGPIMGDYDWGCVFTSVPIIRKDEILMYYGANDGRFMGWRSGYFALAHLRPDGFAGYEQQFPGGRNKTARITTKPLTAVTDSLAISADVVPSGYVKVIALDKDNNKLAEGELIARTVTDAAVQWKDGFKELKGKKIKLSFELRDSKLYSFSFGSP